MTTMRPGWEKRDSPAAQLIDCALHKLHLPSACRPQLRETRSRRRLVTESSSAEAVSWLLDTARAGSRQSFEVSLGSYWRQGGCTHSKVRARDFVIPKLPARQKVVAFWGYHCFGRKNRILGNWRVQERVTENGSVPLQANAGSGHDVRLGHVEGEAGREVDEDRGELADQLLLNLVSTWWSREDKRWSCCWPGCPPGRRWPRAGAAADRGWGDGQDPAGEDPVDAQDVRQLAGEDL